MIAPLFQQPPRTVTRVPICPNGSHILALGPTYIITNGNHFRDAGVKQICFRGFSDEPTPETNIPEVVEEIFSKIHGSFRWVCGRVLPGATSTKPLTAMVLILANIKPPRESIATFELLKKDLSPWKEVVSVVYAFEPDDINLLCERYQKKSASFYHMVARINGIAVGAGTLHLYMGIAMLHNISTLPTARGQGVASELVFRLLKFAESKKASACYIYATEMAQRMYQSQGFKILHPVYANIFEYREPSPTRALQDIPKTAAEDLDALAKRFGGAPLFTPRLPSAEDFSHTAAPLFRNQTSPKRKASKEFNPTEQAPLEETKSLETRPPKDTRSHSPEYVHQANNVRRSPFTLTQRTSPSSFLAPT